MRIISVIILLCLTTYCNFRKTSFTTETVYKSQTNSSNLLHVRQQSKWNCYRHFIESCDVGKGVANCFDNFTGAVRYNKSGCIDSVIDCSCATFKEIEDTLEIGKCLFNCLNRDINMLDNTFGYTLIPPNPYEWNNFFCGAFNRSGVLCGSCQKGLHPQAYSFDLSCFNCTSSFYDWLKYILIAYVPLTCLCIFILTSRLVVPSTSLHGFVLYCQILSTPTIARIGLVFTKNQLFTYRSLQVVGSIYGIWNLDFIRTFDLGICLNIDTMTALSLDLAIAIYPLIFIAFTYIIVKLSDAKNKTFTKLCRTLKFTFKCFYKYWDAKASTVDCFAMFMLLSSVKLLNICYDILLPTEVITLSTKGNITRSWRLYCNATVSYFSYQHLPYAITAIIVLITNIIAPTLLLFLYPFQKCQYFLNKLPHRWQLVTNTFVDSFQGCYKDGTQASTMDCRPFSAMSFIIRILFFVIYGITLNSCFSPLATIFCTLLCILFILLNPLKTQYYNSHQTSILFMLNLGLFGVCTSGHILTYGLNFYFSVLFFVLAAIVGSLPLFYPLVYLITFVKFILIKCKKT